MSQPEISVMDSVKRVLADLNGWVTTPIVGKVDVMHLFLVTGLVLVFLIMWLAMNDRLTTYLGVVGL